MFNKTITTKILFWLSLLIVLGGIIQLGSLPAAQDISPKPSLVPEEIIVRLDASARQEDLNQIIDANGGVILKIEQLPDGGRMERVKFPGASLSLLEELSRDIGRVVGVLSVSPHWRPGRVH